MMLNFFDPCYNNFFRKNSVSLSCFWDDFIRNRSVDDANIAYFLDLKEFFAINRLKIFSVSEFCCNFTLDNEFSIFNFQLT